LAGALVGRGGGIAAVALAEPSPTELTASTRTSSPIRAIAPASLMAWTIEDMPMGLDT